ncbi:MAG: GNAT family N-acetyltransferase [Acidimicrobiales bacterium]
MEIREAAPGDWSEIWPFYAEIVTAGETIAFPEPPDMEADRSLWMESPPGRTVVAKIDGQIAGSAKMGPNRPARGSHIATASFMVAPAYRNRGVGRGLALHALDWARAAGYHGMQFNAVVETNGAAVGLWQSLGFEIVGTVPKAFDHKRHGLVGMHVMYMAF